ncbi:MAG: hypothetical protein AAF193_12280, partial [Bacteroidota bacterium]
KVSLNTIYTGVQFLPEYDSEFNLSTRGEDFFIHHISASYQYQNWTLRIGVQNLLDRIQEDPLVNPSEPFSDTFDTAYVYAPVQGRRFNFGLIYEIEGKRTR